MRENESLRGFAKLRIGTEYLHPGFFRGRREMEIRCLKQGLSRELCEVIGESRVDNTAYESLSENNVGRQVLHHDRGHRFIEMVYFRYQVAGVYSLLRQSQIFEIAPLERQRPCLPNQAQIGERLFDDQASTLPF